MTNLEIYNLFDKLNKNFDGSESFPVKFNFILQKNLKKLQLLISEIEEARMAIGKKYGTNVEGGYEIAEEKLEIANQEYMDLMTIEQDVDFIKVSINTLPEDCMLTAHQMEALMFMIEEE